MIQLHRWRAGARALLLATASAGLTQAQAQQDMRDLRDPTVPPAAASAERAPGVTPRSPLGADGFSVIVRDGKPGLVVGSRVVQPGQKVGALVLERITETDIWLRDGKTLRKVPRYSGIERYDTVSEHRCASPVAATPHRPHHGKTARLAAPKSVPAPSSTDTLCEASPPRSSTP